MTQIAFLIATAVLIGSVATPYAFAQTGTSPVNVSQSLGPSTTPTAAFDSAGTLHVAWADNPEAQSLAEQFVFYSRSHDGGLTFEAPRRLSTGVDEGTRAREVRLVATSGGMIALAWWAPVVTDGKTFMTAIVARSDDGGDTFAPARQSTLKIRLDRAQKEGFSNTTSLSIAAGPGGDLYLLGTLPDYAFGFNVYFARMAADGAFSPAVRVSTYSQVIPRATTNAIAVLASGTIYTVWTEGNGDFYDEIKDVYFSVSSNAGRSFSPPALLAKNVGAVAAVLPVNGTAPGLLAQLQRTPRKLPVTYLYRLSKSGTSVKGRGRVGEARSNSHLNQSSAAVTEAGAVVVAWVENAPTGAPTGIYISTSLDGGKTFGAPERVEEGLFAEPPAIVVDPSGRAGLVFTSSNVSVADREILFRRIDLP